MNERDIIREILKLRNMTQADLAEKVGYSSAASVSMMLTRQSMKADGMLKFLDPLNCELVIRMKDENREWVVRY